MEKEVKEIVVAKNDKENEYKKLQNITESIANEMRRLKIENEDLEKQIAAKDEFMSLQEAEIVKREEHKKKVGKKKKFLCG